MFMRSPCPSLWLLALVSPTAIAQSVTAQPDAGQILNEQQQLQPKLQERLPQPGEGGQELITPAPEAVKVMIRAVRFTGADGMATDDELQAQVKDAIGRELDYAGLQQLAERITRYLKNKGYPLANAYLPAQPLDNGLLEIAIQAGRVDGRAGGIDVRADAVRLKQNIIRDTVARAVFRDAQPGVLVKRIEIAGSKAFSSEELHALVADAEGKTLDFAAIQALAARVTEFYRQHQRLTVHAILPPQDFGDGVVRILMVKATNAKELDANKQVTREQFARIASVDSAQLKTENLERGLLLLNDMPGIAARANLEKGDTPGTSKIVVNVEEEPMFGGSLWADNYGNRYSGKPRLNAQLHLNDPLKAGDQLGLMLTHAQDLDQIGLDYHVPVGSSGLKLGANASYLDYSIGKELSSLESQGTARTAGVDVSYPFIRTRYQSLWGGLAYTNKRLKDELLGTRVHDKRINAVTASLTGNRQDQWGGGGVTNASVLLTRGDLDLSGVASDLAADRVSAKTDGGYTKANLNLVRLQRLTERLSFYGAFNSQVTGDNLDSSEKFILGGPSGVRAYPVGEGSGDSGWVTNLELRYDLPVAPAIGELQLVGFFDTGRVKLHQHPWTGSVTNAENANSYGLSGAGIGINLTHSPRFAMRAAVASAIGSNPGRTSAGNNTDGKNDRVQTWLQAVLWF